MKTFEFPEVERIVFDAVDIVTTSCKVGSQAEPGGTPMCETSEQEY